MGWLLRCRLWSDRRTLRSQTPLRISLTVSCSRGRGGCLQCLAGPQLVVLMALGPSRPSLQRLWVRWGRRRGRNWGSERADPTSALAHLCVLSLSLFQSGRQKPSVRGTLERTDCCSSVHLPTQLDKLSICPSSWSPALNAGNGWGWHERLIRDQVLSPFTPWPSSRCGGGTQEDGRCSPWPQGAHGLVWEDETHSWRG